MIDNKRPTFAYFVAIAIADGSGHKVGHETIYVEAYLLADAVSQAIFEVGARNGLGEREVKLWCVWIGPAVPALLALADEAAEKFWLSRQPNVSETAS